MLAAGKEGHGLGMITDDKVPARPAVMSNKNKQPFFDVFIMDTWLFVSKVHSMSCRTQIPFFQVV